jgi:hypothetical protein
MEICWTKDSHFVFGYNGIPFSSRKQSTDRLFVKYGSAHRSPSNFGEESVLAAQQIQTNFNSPIYLCLSGGIDSEFLVRTFIESKVPFEVLIMRLNDDLNLHDIGWALRLCQSHKLKFRFLDLHVQKFFSSPEYDFLLEESKTVYPMLTTQMKLIEHVCLDLNGIPVLGSGECLVQKINDRWYQVDSEPILSLYQFMRSRNYRGVPAFFQWSPELVLSFLLDPLIQDLYNNRFPEASTSTSFKLEIYQRYFPIEARPKFYGFEQFELFMQDLLKKAHLRFPGSNQQALIEIKHLIATLSQNHFSNDFHRNE